MTVEGGSPMDLKKLKRYLISQPGATEGTAFGPEHLTYKVMGKLFAVVAWDEDPVRISLKGDPAEVEALRKVFPAVQPPPYFNKKHWNLVVVDGSVPGPEFLAMIDESYRLVVKGLTRKQRENLNQKEVIQ
jgi:predicted DNA-binding protein (MmcQ/YjbR family)